MLRCAHSRRHPSTMKSTTVVLALSIVIADAFIRIQQPLQLRQRELPDSYLSARLHPTCSLQNSRSSGGSRGGDDQLVSLPVHPIRMLNSRQTRLPASEVEALRSLQAQLQQQAGHSELPGIVILPSWRQHVVQFDGMCAALELLGLPSVVAPIPDGLWAFSLKRLGVRQMHLATKQRVVGLQVSAASTVTSLMLPTLFAMRAGQYRLASADGRHSAGRSVPLASADGRHSMLSDLFC